MDGGITNHTIIDFFNKEENEDIKKIFTGAYPSNFVNGFIKFLYYYERKQQSRISFLNNEYRQNRQKRHALVELDIHPKTEIFLFYSFCFNGLKEFIIQDDKDMIII